MRNAKAAVGIASAALVATTVTVPAFAGAAHAAAGLSPASCEERVIYKVHQHERRFIYVRGSKIRFTSPGRHTVSVSESGNLQARYGTASAADWKGIRTAARAEFSDRIRHRVFIPAGLDRTFRITGDDETVIARLGSRGDRVRWRKVQINDDCTRTLLNNGRATFPRDNVRWLLRRTTS